MNCLIFIKILYFQTYSEIILYQPMNQSHFHIILLEQVRTYLDFHWLSQSHFHSYYYNCFECYYLRDSNSTKVIIDFIYFVLLMVAIVIVLKQLINFISQINFIFAFAKLSFFPKIVINFTIFIPTILKLIFYFITFSFLFIFL